MWKKTEFPPLSRRQQRQRRRRGKVEAHPTVDGDDDDDDGDEEKVEENSKKRYPEKKNEEEEGVSPSVAPLSTTTTTTNTTHADEFDTIEEKIAKDWLALDTVRNVHDPPLSYSRNSDGEREVTQTFRVYSRYGIGDRLNFSHCPFRALFAYHLKSGLVRQHEATLAEFESALPTTKEKNGSIDRAKNTLNAAALLVGCAGCGIVLPQNEASLEDISAMTFLMSSDTQREAFEVSSDVYKSARNVFKI